MRSMQRRIKAWRFSLCPLTESLPPQKPSVVILQKDSPYSLSRPLPAPQWLEVAVLAGLGDAPSHDSNGSQRAAYIILTNCIATRSVWATNVKDQLAYGATLGSPVCSYVPSAVCHIQQGSEDKGSEGIPSRCRRTAQMSACSASMTLSLQTLVHLTPTMLDFEVCGAALLRLLQKSHLTPDFKILLKSNSFHF